MKIFFEGFPNRVEGGGNGWMESKLLRRFFGGWWETGEWFWRFKAFSKLKTVFCEYWTSIKSKISMTCVYKQYETVQKQLNCYLVGVDPFCGKIKISLGESTGRGGNFSRWGRWKNFRLMGGYLPPLPSTLENPAIGWSKISKTHQLYSHRLMKEQLVLYNYIILLNWEKKSIQLPHSKPPSQPILVSPTIWTLPLKWKKKLQPSSKIFLIAKKFPHSSENIMS